ncbi:MAG: TIM barrel protein [Lentisphaeria bacterium]|nr:TIM barrel protein [Lentisphaeria bacterium]
MLKFAAYFDLFFKNEPYERRAELFGECGYEYAETWRGADLAELKAMTSRDVKLISVLVGGGKECSPSDLETRAAFLERVDLVADNALAVGCDRAIVTAGNQLRGKSYQNQRSVLVESLAMAGEKLKSRGFSLNLETLNTDVNHPGYLLNDPNDTVAICKETGCGNIKMLYDIYHMGIMTGNLTDFLRFNIGHIGHFHLAAIPGRHEPKRGETNYPFLLGEIDKLGYEGYIGLEYTPLLPDRESLLETREYLNF